eukprot:TRINITY_DN59108_c0_g1_i1.p1 TRINITY_DN59108_c0_g1~~TRINITY_DN59108_c0_g1_i1.p1  ORF type:complete len:558 (+),score=129.26 TRINITY_DN59108_c0_g1_i1:214-1887(+)
MGDPGIEMADVETLKAAKENLLAPRRMTRQQRQSVMVHYVGGADSSTGKPLRPAASNSWRVGARTISSSGPWLFSQTLAVLLDALMLALLLSHDVSLQSCRFPRCPTGWAVVTVTLYWLDIGLRVFALTAHVYFSKIGCNADLAVVIIGTIETLMELQGSALLHPDFELFGRAVRLLRFLRIQRGLRHSSDNACNCMRHITGENKRRFVDPENEFDLDLVYITGQLIGMSVPADGWLSRFYRNPLSEVVRFFERFHEQHYLIVNVCPEMPYPASAFATGSVECFDIQDHTPPLLGDLVKFLRLAQKWLSRHPKNVLAVHCRGGKGRTGSFCCSWLLYSGEAEDAQDALNFFAIRRTDLEKNSEHKVQGVETPSQVRYIEYISRMLSDQGVSPPKNLLLPPPKEVKLLNFSLSNFFLPGKEPEEAIVCVQDQGTRRFLVWSNSSSPAAASTWDLRQIRVSGDIRVSLFGRDGLPSGAELASVRRKEAEKREQQGEWPIAGKEKGCLFYVIFHTAFLGDSGKLTVPMSMVDKACKKTKLYNQDGQATISFASDSPLEVY